MGLKRILKNTLILLLTGAICVGCGKTANPVNSDFSNAVANLNTSENRDVQEVQEGQKEGTDALANAGIRFTIMDSNTLKASIKLPIILAYATDMSQVQLKIYSDDSALKKKNGSVAFLLQFFENDGDVTCNVYPQTCRVEGNDQDGRSSIIDDYIVDSEGAPIAGVSSVSEAELIFYVSANGLADMVKDCTVYQVNVDYKEVAHGEISEIGTPDYVTPDLSATSIGDKVDISYFDKLLPDYFVIEQKFDKYISYDDHGCASLKDDFAPNGRDIIWCGRKNKKDMTKTSLLLGSIDEFGVANYYVVQVYDSYQNLMTDYIAAGIISLTYEFGKLEPDNDLVNNAMLEERFLPKDGSDFEGSWSYKHDNNIMYWTFTSDFREHYVYSDGLFVPDVKFNYGGSTGNAAGLLELNDLDDSIRTLLEDGSIEATNEYTYYWDARPDGVGAPNKATGTYSLTGIYHKGVDNEKDNGNEEESDHDGDEAIIAEALRIREEIIKEKAAETEETEAIKNASTQIDPSLNVTVYDDVSTDMLLYKIDENVLINGGYEIDFDQYTLHISGNSLENPKCTIGKINEGEYESLYDINCNQELYVAPNYIRLNVFLDDSLGVSWKQIDSFELYAVDKNGTRTKIDKEINIERYN